MSVIRLSCVALLSVLLCITILPVVAQEPIFSYDFEQGADPAGYESLKFANAVPEIVEGGLDGTGHCLKFTSAQPDRYCQLTIQRDIQMVRNLTLSFDHREEVEEGQKAAYLGILFYDAQNNQWWGSDRFEPRWRHFEISVGSMGSPTHTDLSIGHVFNRLNLYGRADGDTKATMTVWLDNIVLTVKEPAPGMSDDYRVSTANPPLFNWPRGKGLMRLEYSQSPDFPPDATVGIDTEKNWHTPSKPMEPGVWYWRVRTETELASGYTDTRRVEITPEAHRFSTRPVPVDEITARPRPWVIPAKEVPDDQKPALVRSAQSLAKTGIPDDPPAYAPGNPDWPTWIDWYGKVHGGITSAAGRRLQQIAEIYVKTRDPQVLSDLKQMALKAATWDPAGGSSMRNGDIGAQHFLRGLSWCYDAACNDLSADERAQLRAIIIRRAEDFWKSANPFPRGGSEFNNHSWLRAFCLGEAGLVLLGEHAEAADWAQYVLELYIGRFLCALGYQGDNNEGIGYWAYGLSFVIDYADMMKYVCAIDLFEHPWLNQTARFPMYSAPPAAWAVSFADTGKPNHGTRGPAATSYVGRLATRTGDPYALWYSGRQATDDGLQPRPPVDIPQSIHYKFIGWSIFNTSLVDGRQGVTFAMRSGPFYAGHQHEDQNGFVIHAYGEKLAIDSGWYDWYGSPHFKEYSVLTRAHNAILVNEQDQGSRKLGADGKTTAYFDSPAYGYTVGDASDPDMYMGQLKRWDRRALFIKPGFVIIHDVLDAQKDVARYDWLLHTVAPVETDADTQTFALTSGGAKLRGRFISPADLDLRITRGYPVEPVDGYSTRPVPPERYVDEWTLTATPRGGRGAEEFLTAMQIERAEGGADADIKQIDASGGLGVAIVTGEESHLALFRSAGAEGDLQGGGLSTDGTSATLSSADGQLRRFAAFGATSLGYRDRTLLRTDGVAADFSAFRTEDGVLLSMTVAEPAVLDIDRLGVRGDVMVDAGARETQSGDRLSIRLNAGEHTIAWGPHPDRLPDYALPALPAGDGALEGYSQLQGDGRLNYWWGQLPVAKSDKHEIVLDGWDGPTPPQVTLDGQAMGITQADGRLLVARWLEAGEHSVTITGRGGLMAVKLVPLGVADQKARMMPVDFAPAEGSIIVEAEAPDAEGEVKGLRVEKVAASGGIGNCSWDTDGQWAEWLLRVPQAGTYNLLVRAASEYDDLARVMTLNGKPIADAIEVVRFAGTGGWCRTANDWRYFMLLDAAGKPALVTLEAGTHRLRMERLSGSMNLDLFALQPVGP